MLHIVINGRFLTQSITGVQRYAREIVHAFDRLLDARSDVTMELVCPPATTDLPVYRNIPVRRIGSGGGHRWEQASLPGAVGDGILFCPGNTAPIRSLLGGTKTVVTVHDLSYRYFPSAYSRAYRLVYNLMTPMILRRADAVLTVSEPERRSIIEHYPVVAPRLVAIQNGGLAEDVVIDRPRPADLPPPGYVLYVGSLSKRKNFPMMFDVACEMAASRGTRFVFVGGTEASLEQSDRSVPPDIAEHILFAGQVNETDRLVDWYNGAAAFLFPSLYESSGLPPMEAMACGVPVVASRIPALEERCGDAALYCDASDRADIIATLSRLLDDPLLHADLSARSRARAAEYDWRNCAIKTLDVFRNVDAA
ncbi:glycosyl transferase [Sphingomonas spermidinifaciens]|uniref:Glycosyl transferase n=1 Tax=Sphingomonas spermidinifaciens TaxID=1141889 RepID=A0A2A4AZY2_9SPHN|nr:glycosyltransferase family 1 protein [Sphingomonas spermidinifaciens]PCD01731.1 glycosyl transferase [Sphingomonas spermidinifaciens]